MRAFTLLVFVSIPALAADSKPYTDLPQGTATLWHDPGAVEHLDFRYGVGGRALEPRPPFRFVKEDTSGSNPKVQVRDGRSRQWVIKFGNEARPDTFASRIEWAVGYFAEPNYFVASGVIHGMHSLHRALRVIDESGHFTGGRFQLRAKYPEYLDDVSWSWDHNPFLGTREFNGLRILMMLVSNWDDKDIRDEREHGLSARYHQLIKEMKPGSNNAIYRVNGRRYLYFIDDWGASMGAWGGPLHRSKWDCVDYLQESRHFVRGIRDGQIEWGYHGVHTADMREGIRPADVSWLMRYLGRISDQQLRAGLAASGATPDETACYTEALRTRINQLKDAASGQLSAR